MYKNALHFCWRFSLAMPTLSYLSLTFLPLLSRLSDVQSGTQSDFQCKRQRFVLLTFVRPDEEEEQQLEERKEQDDDGNNLR